MWLPQIPSCNSSRSNSDVLRWMHNRYGPEKERLYSFWSSDSQNRGAFRRIFSASSLSDGKVSSFKNDIIGSIQLDPTRICWTWAAISFILVGLYKSSTRMTRGRLWAEEDASVARESACVFPLLGMWCRLNDSNFDCRSLIWFKYSYILSSLAFSYPPT